MSAPIEQETAIGRIKGLFAARMKGEPGSVLNIVVDENPNYNEDWDICPTVHITPEVQEHIHKVIYPIAATCAEQLGYPKPKFQISIQNPDSHTIENRPAKVAGLSEGLGILLAMLSSIMRIPLRQDIAVTAAISDTTGTCGLVSLEGKLDATEKENLTHILVGTQPPPEIAADKKDRITKNNHKLIQEYAKAVDTIPITHLSKALPLAFHRKDVLHYLITHNHLGPKADPLPDDPQPQAKALIDFLERTRYEFWEEMDHRVGDGDLQESKNLLASYLDACLQKQQTFPENTGMQIAKLHMRHPMNQFFKAIDGGISLTQWLTLAGHIEKERSTHTSEQPSPTYYQQWKDLLFLLFQYEIDDAEARAIYNNQEFIDAIRELYLTALKDWNVPIVMRVITILRRSFDEHFLHGSIFLDDLTVMLRQNYFPEIINLYDQGMRDYQERLRQRGSASMTAVSVSDLNEVFFSFSILLIHINNLVGSIVDIDSRLGLSLFNQSPLLGYFTRSCLHMQRMGEGYQHPQTDQDIIDFNIIGNSILNSYVNPNIYGMFALNLHHPGEERINTRTLLKVSIPYDLSVVHYDALDQSDPSTDHWIGGNEIRHPVTWCETSHRFAEFWRTPDWTPEKCEIFTLPDGHTQITRKDGTIEKTDGPLLYSVFGSTFLFEYAGVQLWLNARLGHFPDIEDLFLLRVLSESGYASQEIESIYDISTKSGCFGVFLSVVCPKIKKTYIHCYSYAQTKMVLKSFELNNHQLCGRPFTADMTVRRHNRIIGHNRVDLALCHPRCLPEMIDFAHSLDIEESNGTELLNRLVTTGGSFCKKLVILVSSLVIDDVAKRAAEVGATFSSLASDNFPMRGPFLAPIHPTEISPGVWQKFPDSDARWSLFEHQKSYAKYLEDHPKIELRSGPESRNYKYWHKMHVCSVKYD